jgi:undecaprenyl-diphosphatase
LIARLYVSPDAVPVVAAAVSSMVFVAETVRPGTLAALIAYSRVYLGVHYPFDVVGGAAIGVVCGWLAVWIRSRLARR